MGYRNQQKSNRDTQDSPAAWFVELEIARRANDYERAARAVRELKRLGVSVKYIRRERGNRHD